MRAKKLLSSQCKETFLLKPEFMLWHTIEILDVNVERFKLDWLERYNRSPALFLDMPVIIDVSRVVLQEELDLDRVCSILHASHVNPVGVRGLSEEHYGKAKKQGLSLLRAKVNDRKSEDLPGEKKSNHLSGAKVISEPIRSGQRLYVENRDLIILSSVNGGAEVISDGNIHVYGPVRGRVLAGARGNEDARIFCSIFDAELISIAGYYLVKEDMPSELNKAGIIQVRLHNKTLLIEDI